MVISRGRKSWKDHIIEKRAKDVPVGETGGPQGKSNAQGLVHSAFPHRRVKPKENCKTTFTQPTPTGDKNSTIFFPKRRMGERYVGKEKAIARKKLWKRRTGKTQIGDDARRHNRGEKLKVHKKYRLERHTIPHRPGLQGASGSHEGTSQRTSVSKKGQKPRRVKLIP